MRRMDDCIDMVITSPPYDDLRTYTKESSWNEISGKRSSLNRIGSSSRTVLLFGLRCYDRRE